MVRGCLWLVHCPGPTFPHPSHNSLWPAEVHDHPCTLFPLYDELRTAVQKDVTCQQLSDIIWNGWPMASHLERTSIFLASLLFNERWADHSGWLAASWAKLYYSTRTAKVLCWTATSGPSWHHSNQAERWGNYILAINAHWYRHWCLSLRTLQCNQISSKERTTAPSWNPGSSLVFYSCWPVWFTRKTHLVHVDSLSGWFELDYLPGMKSITVIAKLKRHFAVHGIPYTLMTDNATQSVCKEFADFAHMEI